MATYDNKPLDGNGLSHLWAKIKAQFALKTELPAAGSTTPVMDGTGNTGTSTDYARADHVHPSDTSRAPTSHASTSTTYGKGTSGNYGHVKLSDATNGTSAAASGGTAATPKAVSDALKAAKDYADGKADTNTTYTLTKSGSTITLTGSDSSTTSVTDSDTTYSDFTGATSSAAGANGLVPAPAKGDQNDTLFGSGSWGTLKMAVENVIGSGVTNTAIALYKDSTTSGSSNRISAVTLSPATTSVAGTMSAADKTKLDGIETGAQVHVAPTNAEVIAALGYTPPTSDTNTTYTLTQDSTDGHKITLTPSSGSATTITIPDNDTKALGSMTGTLGVNHGGTGVTTLGAGVVYHSASGTGALSIATASNLVSAIGNSAVNRATADASGNNIATTYLTTSAASTTYLTQTSAASTYATKSEIVGLYKYKGSVATESDLPASPSTGDVYNIEAASSYGAAGANVAWNGTAWDSLGEMFSLDPLTNAEIDAICV